MSVSVDRVVSTMLTSGEAIVVRQKSRIASNLGIPSHISDQWETAHTMLVLDSHQLFSRILGRWVVQNGVEANIGRLTNIMKDMQLLAVAEAISSLGDCKTAIILSGTQQPQASTSTKVTTSKSISFGVKQPIKGFVGRADELKKLNDFFLDQRQNCVVIYAIGGQGKTELCKKFIHDLTTSTSSPPVVVWLPGKSIQEFTSRVSKLAHRLTISKNDDEGKPLPLLRLLKPITKHIKNQFPNQRWLVVIDNVDEEHPEFEKIIKILIDVEAFVLITSRRIDILAGAVSTNPLELETLSTSDAILLVRNSLPNASTEDVTLLCRKVGNHALALQQSVAYVRTQSLVGTRGKIYDISHFLQEFQDRQTLILQHPLKLANYNHTIHAIVRTTLDSISTKYGNLGKVALELGIILGLINPDGIHFDILQKFHNLYTINRLEPAQRPAAILSSLFRELYGNGGRTTSFTSALSTPTETREAVLLLAKFSMVNLNDEVVSIHRLVQMVLRLEYENRQAINILLKHIGPKDASINELRQVMSIWEHADNETVKTYSNFANQIFDRMDDLSLVLELRGFAEKNHTLLSQLLGPNHEETLRMEYSIASAMHKQGDYEIALTNLRALHEKMKRALGEEHPSTLATAWQISTVLWCLSRHEEGLEWRERELESTVKVLGENYSSTIHSLSSKAIILMKLGRMDEALTIHQQALEWNEVKLGSSHPQTLSTRQIVAQIRFHQKQFHQAGSEFETLLKLSVEVLGEEHVDTLAKKYWLACTNWELNRREDAIRMMEEVLVSQEKVLGHNHPDTNITRNRLSTWIEEQRGDLP